MKISRSLKDYFGGLTLCLISAVCFTSCGSGSGSGPGNTDTAPATLEGLELFFIEGLPFSFQFAKIGGDAEAGGESGFSNSFRPGEDRTTSVTNEFGSTAVYELCESMTNIAYTYLKTGPNTGVIVIAAQSDSNTINDLDIFSDAAEGSDITFTIDITFGSLGGVIGEIAIELQDVPSDDGPLTYTLTTAGHAVSILTQDGAAVPVGYDEQFALGVYKKTPAKVYPAKLSDLAIPGVMTFDNGDVYDLLGVTSDDQGFGSDGRLLDQGVLGVKWTKGMVITDVGTVAYAWYDADDEGSSNMAKLRLAMPGGTEVYLFEFVSFEDARFTRITPDDGEAGAVNFPFADN